MRLLLAGLWIVLPILALAEEPNAEISYDTRTDILYRHGEDLTPAMEQRCRLDVYYPVQPDPFPTIVWFHGGGLTGGKRSIPKELRKQGVAVVAPSYRLSPGVKSPAYVQDAAAAVAWTIKNIHSLGGDPDQVFVSGHSAGGYLTSMVVLDKSYLKAHQVDADRIAGAIPYSGHTITHFTVRAERGIDGKTPVVDEMAPLRHVRPDAPPLLLITGDRELEMLGRYEENAYLWRMMKVAGHPNTRIIELKEKNHGGMVSPAHPHALQFIREILSSIEKDKVIEAR